MAYVTTRDNTKLYLKDWGSGRPVIMIHGWPLSADSWDDLSLAIADNGFRALSYDRRGFGRSDQPWSGYNYDTFADDMAAVIEETGAKDATVIGFSMGGGEIARYMSRHNGKNVAQAVLIASVVPYMLKTSDNPKGVDQSVFDQIMAGIKQDRPHFMAGFIKDFFSGSMLTKSVSNEMLEWGRDVSLQAGLKPTLDCVRAFSTTDFRPDLASFSVPTLVIHGSGDKIVPIDATGREAARGIRNAKFIEYDGAPHGLFATHKEQLIKDVLTFLHQ